MARDNQDLTKGPLARKILFFSAPLIVSNLLQVLFNVADIAVVGRFAGASALGSVGSTTILVTMFTSFLIGVSGGINVLTALYLGSGDRKGVRAFGFPVQYSDRIDPAAYWSNIFKRYSGTFEHEAGIDRWGGAVYTDLFSGDAVFYAL